ncbi:hypothetical protein [Skermanella stibiiresistens]|nr:hypothetical protein [Skermanella stibiiresistens]
MTESVDPAGDPDELESAFDLVRALWVEEADGGPPRQVVAWAMMVEAVNHLTVLHGPDAMAGMLDELRLAVLEEPGSGTLPTSGTLPKPGTLQ